MCSLQSDLSVRRFTVPAGAPIPAQGGNPRYTGLFDPVENSRMRPSGWALKPDTFRWAMRHRFFPERAVNQGSKLPKEVANSPSLDGVQPSPEPFREMH